MGAVGLDEGDLAGAVEGGQDLVAVAGEGEVVDPGQAGGPGLDLAGATVALDGYAEDDAPVEVGDPQRPAPDLQPVGAEESGGGQFGGGGPGAGVPPVVGTLEMVPRTESVT